MESNAFFDKGKLRDDTTNKNKSHLFEATEFLSSKNSSSFDHEWNAVLPAIRTSINEERFPGDKKTYATPRSSFTLPQISVHQSWSMVTQRRPGAHHGKGGRHRGRSALDRKAHVCDEICTFSMHCLRKILKKNTFQCIQALANKILECNYDSSKKNTSESAACFDFERSPVSRD